MLREADALVAKFPDAPCVHLARLSVLAALTPPEEYLRELAEVGRRFGRDPAVQILWLRQPGGDISRNPPARRMLHTLLRRMQASTPPAALFLLAYELGSAGYAEEARELVRFAACAEDKNESCARGYMAAMRFQDRADEGLAFLRQRFETHGRASSGPALTLLWALEGLGRQEETTPVLERALAIRPRDSDLRLAAAESFARRRVFDRAEELLATARGCTRRASWLRVAGAVAAQRNDRASALRLWREVLEGEPWAADANGAVAILLAATEGRDVGASHLASAYSRFPRHEGLRQLCEAWARETQAIERREVESQRAAEPTLARFGMLYPVLLMLLMQAIGRGCLQQ
jgi:tetratricopeptide (TPR) repeat protein